MRTHKLAKLLKSRKTFLVTDESSTGFQKYLHVKILEQLRYRHECSMFCEIRYNKFETYTVNWKDLLRAQLPVKPCKPQV